jgi:hypothetical protein
MYARDTDVSSGRSRGEIESTLRRYGATSYAYASREDAAMVEFQANGKRIRFILPMPRRDDDRFTLTGCLGRSGHSKTRAGYHSPSCYAARPESQAYELWEQSTRQRWRALNLVIKAKLEAVESKITTMEQEFLAQIVLPNGRTAGETMIPQIEQFYLDKKVTALTWEGK